MDSQNLKRKRERTFEYVEKSVLLDLVTEHFNIIECKKTDGVSVKLKNAEWQKIAEKFTATSSTYPRDAHSLKTLWENLKRKAKAALAMQADNNYGTGGGKARKVVADPIVDMVVGLIRPHVEPFHNIYDDNYEEGMSNITTDKTDTNEFEEIILRDVLCPEDINNDLEDEDISLQNNWSQYNPAMMKTQISAALRQPPKASLPIPSTSKMSTNITNANMSNMSEDIQPKTVLTPSKDVDGKKGVSRRRPVLNTTLASETFLEAKKLSLDAMSRDAGEEHKVQMKILKLKLLQEEEKLKQEKMKTEILKLQIQRETGTEWLFDRNNETDNID